MAKYFGFPNYEPGVTPAALTGIAQADLDGFSLLEYKQKAGTFNGSDYLIEGTWEGGAGIVIATYNSFPIGSKVWDVPGSAVYLKTAASTWVSEALT